MSPSPKRILVIAGEASSDAYAALLIRELLRKDPSLKITAMAGERSRGAGADLIENLVQHAVIGFAGVLKNLDYFRGQLRRVEGILSRREVDAVIPIDYPGFNLRVCRMAHQHGVKVIYYVSPQVWAWGKGREKKIARWVNKMLVTFPFEEEIYRRAGCGVEFVGNPLLDLLEDSPPRPSSQVRSDLGLGPDQKLIALLPGSRRGEVERLLPPLLGAVRILSSRQKNLLFCVSSAPTVGGSLVERLVQESGLSIRIWSEDAASLLASSDVAVVKSGTGALQSALLGVPTVVVYRLGGWEYLLGRLLVNVEHIAMPNILLNRRVLPELIQGEASPERIASSVEALLGPEEESIRRALEPLRGLLGGQGASARAAEEILKTLGESR